jgi:hypothetical protein
MRSHNIPALVLALSLLLPAAAPARAGDYTYRPEDCEFQMTFPEAPYSARHCNPDIPDKCEVKTAFTKVYGTDATMNFYVSCNPIPDGAFAGYDRDALKTTLLAMAGRSRLDNYQTAYDEDKEVKRASILGAGPSYNKKNPMLYMGEIWVGQHSLLTVEGELIGEDSPESDGAFAHILQSIVTTKYADAQEKAAAQAKKEKNSSKSKK